MHQLRVYYDEGSGGIRWVENRPDGKYSEENRVPSENDLAVLVVDAAELAELPSRKIYVRGGKLGRPEGEPTIVPELDNSRALVNASRIEDEGDRRRIQEIAETDKQGLSDGEWLALYREFVTLTKRF